MKAPSFWYPEGDERLPFWAPFLAPLAGLYDGGGRLRRRMTKPHRAKVPVLCIGNLTAGGTGKTPIAIGLARLLLAEGLRPVFLTRGYGGREAGPLVVDPAQHQSDDVGDEPLLLAKIAPTVVARKRVDGSALAERLKASVILMDDGFQNPELYKDFSIVVVDGARLFGNERVIPLGPLREPVSVGLARADLVIVRDPTEKARERLEAVPLPKFAAVLEPSPDAADLSGQRVLAFAGIGHPENFFETVMRTGAQLVEREAFPDHHPYSAEEVDRLRKRAEEAGLRLVTTEKDAVRLPSALRGDVATIVIDAVFDDPAGLTQAMMEAIRAHPA